MVQSSASEMASGILGYVIPPPSAPARETDALETGIIIKWAILATLFFIFVAWFLGGYLHAKSRLRKGKPLLAYHRVRAILSWALQPY